MSLLLFRCWHQVSDKNGMARVVDKYHVLKSIFILYINVYNHSWRNSFLGELPDDGSALQLSMRYVATIGGFTHLII